MAYNLQSLITILEQILNPKQTRWILDDHNRPQLQSLLQKACSLKQILQKSSHPNIESFESQIRDATHRAEDLIESHMADQMLSRPEGASFTFLTPNLQQVTQELDSVMQQVLKLTEGNTVSSGSSSSSGASSSHDPTSKSLVVGLDKDLMQLKDRLTGMESKLEIDSIVGMGGIGKTTLAQNLYQDPLIVEHFRVRAWATISQDYNMREILLALLCCIIRKETDKHIEKKDNELKDVLYQNLYGRRYVIVLDDIWSTQFWDEMRKYFPDNNNGSRIVITTRESDVAKYANSKCKQHEMHLLSESESWNLLQKEVFGEENCTDDALERIGRNIASNCGGLPLAIHVIGGLLSKTDRARDSWENVATDVRTAVSKKDEFSNILSLSYNHLPSHLRPCFLYMGAFPEDYEIKASKLIRLWEAEGFLRSNTDNKSLEEEAEDCLNALVGRNLVSIRALKSNGRPKRYGIHDLMRDLCLKKAEQQRFIHVMNKQVGEVEEGSMCSLRRVSVHRSYRLRDIYASVEFMSLARSFICTGLPSRFLLCDVFFGLRLLRVLDVFEMEFKDFPLEILHIANLRYLAFSYNSDELPSDISRLLNLQTLVIRSNSYCIALPSEILQMAELRHVMVYEASILLPPDERRGFVQENLQTIFTLYNPSNDLFDRIPNMKNMGIQGSRSIDLRHLHKLEKLKLYDPYVSLPRLGLPSSLRKLSLVKCSILGEFMTCLCELPNLEVLKLQECVFGGEDCLEWDATQLVFSSLQFLLLERLELFHWEADESNFPRLRRLVIRCCYYLEEIPSAIGEIPTLLTIELDEYCIPSLVASAELIIEEQRELGNNAIQLRP